MIEILNIDCMEYMKTLSDNAFDLAIVDPEYGINNGKQSDKSKFVKQKNGTKIFVSGKVHKNKNWDCKPAGNEYFDELIRVSKNQIIWGVNYYNRVFGCGRIVWDKLNDHSDQNDVEIAYNSINKRQEIVRYLWSGFCQGLTIGQPAGKALIQIGDKSKNEKLIHSAQKPVKLYDWLLKNYAKDGDIILDTHGGSMSSMIACHYAGYDAVCCELDEDYYNSGVERFDDQTRQKSMF